MLNSLTKASGVMRHRQPATRRFVALTSPCRTRQTRDDAFSVSSPARDEYITHPKVFEAINAHLAERGFDPLREGTIVDATFIAAPPSDQNQGKPR